MTTAAPGQSSVPSVGAPAPDFTLASTGGEQVTLSSLRGHNVLLAFFPLAFTSTCTAELCAMRDDYDRFAEHDVVVLPISVDSTATLREYRSKHDMQSHLLSDFKREVSRAYGVLNDERFYANRSYFLVDRDGIVRWAYVEAHNGLRRENDELLAEIAKLS